MRFFKKSESRFYTMTTNSLQTDFDRVQHQKRVNTLTHVMNLFEERNKHSPVPPAGPLPIKANGAMVVHRPTKYEENVDIDDDEGEFIMIQNERTLAVHEENKRLRQQILVEREQHDHWRLAQEKLVQELSFAQNSIKSLQRRNDLLQKLVLPNQEKKRQSTSLEDGQIAASYERKLGILLNEIDAMEAQETATSSTQTRTHIYTHLLFFSPIRHRLVIVRSMSTLPQVRSAASLIVVAPEPLENKEKACNYRILMMKRNAKSSFINAHVYPGGVVDASDEASLWDSQIKSEKEKRLVTNKICAIRETFEESGLLLSEPSAETVKGLDVNIWRHKVHDDASQFKIMCDQFKIRPAVDKLIPFTCWITPEFEKKRYNTLFFLTTLDQHPTQKEHDARLKLVSSDGKETVLFEWLKPEEALQKQKAKQIKLIPPQWYSLLLMSRISDFHRLNQAGIGAFRTKTGEVVPILPQPVTVPKTDDGYEFYLAYPGDENFQSVEFKAEKGNAHRLYFKGAMQDFKLERNIQVDDIVKDVSKL
ncbi:hypothetical protein INT47_001998 [Mucor saturninus]|uniref:Nudix hydrolase domain-containing protein n=1 Tax=Mucor saturninus TaxID=64648 RepID=A0A8H7QZZ4_9FUNG|nr:hypothetical protein INT47_001998 [Mucor saturninus]